MKISPAQIKVCEAIERLTADGPTPPLQVIADELGRSKTIVHKHVGSLLESGFLDRPRANSKALELTNQWRAFKQRRENQCCNPMVVEVSEEHPELFADFTDEDWKQLRSCRGMGGELTMEGVLTLARQINENRRIKDEVARLLTIPSARNQLIALVEQLRDDHRVDPGKMLIARKAAG